MAFVTLYPVGIKTIEGKYFTVESFGDQLNAKGASLKSKQVFHLETNHAGAYAFKTHKGKYLSADHKGAVTAAAASIGEIETFHLEYNDGIVFVKTADNKYLGVDATGNLHTAPTAGERESLEIEINMHPQVCLFSQNRYVGTDDKGNIVSNKNSQFGLDTLFTLEPFPGFRGRYAILAPNGKYLSVEGGQVVAKHDVVGDGCDFSLEPQKENFGIKHPSSGNYVSILGNGLKASKPVCTAKDIFTLVDSDAQITLKANNGKYVAVQGANSITASTEVGVNEIWVMTFQGSHVSLMEEKGHYMSAHADGGLTVDAKSAGPNELFTPEYHFVGENHLHRIAFKSAHGKYLYAKSLGGVDAHAATAGSDDKGTSLFKFSLYNRPYVVFKVDQQSYVGTSPKGEVWGSKATPEYFIVDDQGGKVALKSLATGKYWNVVGVDKKVVFGDEPQFFYFEFRVHTKLSIRTSEDLYISSENNGWLVAKAAPNGVPTSNQEFEY